MPARKGVGCCFLEVDLQRKLPEPPLVIRTTIVSDAALGRLDYAALSCDIVVALEQVQVVVVQKVEGLRTELDIQGLVNREGL